MEKVVGLADGLSTLLSEYLIYVYCAAWSAICICVAIKEKCFVFVWQMENPVFSEKSKINDFAHSQATETISFK